MECQRKASPITLSKMATNNSKTALENQSYEERKYRFLTKVHRHMCTSDVLYENVNTDGYLRDWAESTLIQGVHVDPALNMFNSIKAWYCFNKRKSLSLKLLCFSSTETHVSHFLISAPPSPCRNTYIFQSVFSRLHGFTSLTFTTCELTGTMPDKASEKHRLAYLLHSIFQINTK